MFATCRESGSCKQCVSSEEQAHQTVRIDLGKIAFAVQSKTSTGGESLFSSPWDQCEEAARREEHRRSVEEQAYIQTEKKKWETQKEEDRLRRSAKLELHRRVVHEELRNQEQMADNYQRQIPLREDIARMFLASHGFSNVNEKKRTVVLSSEFTYPLHVAVKGNKPEVVEALLMAGANPTQVDSKNFTPLALALQLNQNDSHLPIVAILS